MPKDPLNRVRHVLEEIAFLESLRLSGTADSFAVDPTRSRAAAYSLQNISEAVRNIPEHMLGEVSGLAWAKIKGIGNITRHEYFRIDAAVIWKTITDDLDDLRGAMHQMISLFGDPDER